MKPKTQYYIGQRFGRLVIIELNHIDDKGRKFFNCRCDCGIKKVIQGSLMSSGNTKSCGCYGLESKKATRKPDNHGEVTAIILGYQRHALDRGFDFLLTRADVNELIRKPCYYCGLPPSNKKTTKNTILPFLYSGIDRIDSLKDYTRDNVVPCCKICNNAKSNLTTIEFKAWAMRLKAMAEQWG